MTLVQSTEEINVRYSGLADQPCCLSCGSAVGHADAVSGEVCVDLGSGRGQDVIRLSEAVGDSGFVYGIDVAEGMIQRARRDAAKLGLTNVEFHRAELESLPLETESVDLVVSNCTINHARDKLRVWREVYRVLKPGGRFVVSDIYATAPVPGEYRSDPVAISECWAGADTRGAYFATLGRAGFEGVTVLDESAPYPKGKIECASFTLLGRKRVRRCCCGR